MKLDEVWLDPYSSKNSQHYGLPLMQNMMHVVELGSIGKTQFIFGDALGLPSLVAINAEQEDQVFAAAYLKSLGKKTYQITSLVALEAYRGFGLPLEMYKAFIKKGYILVSGNVQTEGSKEIWAKLAEEPNVEVLVVKKGSEEHASLDGEEIRKGDGVYTVSPPDMFVIPSHEALLIARRI